MRGPDQLTAGDRAAMQAAVTMPVPASGDIGTLEITLGMIDDQLWAVLGRLVFSWSYPMCLPRDDQSENWADSLAQIPIDDWNVIEDAIEPHMSKLRGSGPKGKTMTTAHSNGTSKDRAGTSRRG